ncbi:MAG TPA: hypothetical protein VK815_03525, partial [Candidatus Acidoferrales bacterium]|nr:hypothetical protein [Candidatus Acidoferrales bacterium]
DRERQKNFSCVASGLRPDVEGGIPAARKEPWTCQRLMNIQKRFVLCEVSSAGLEARLYGSQDGCRYGAAIHLIRLLFLHPLG